VVGPSYAQHEHWLRYQEYFPSGLRIESAAEAPEESWWSWRGRRVHVDRVRRPGAPAKLIALHGIGGYGRMLAPYSRLPSVDAEFVAPDLPGFGLTTSGFRQVTYDTWLRCVTDLVAAERRTDERPIVLMGVGSAGRLAYDVAARAGTSGVPVAGAVATGLADPRRPEVRRLLATTPELGRWSVLLGMMPGSVHLPLPPAWAPVRWLVNIAAMSNHAQFAHAIWADPLGGANWMPLGFLRSFVGAAPAVEPQHYEGPPLLLAHPAEDRWTPPRLSKEFFDRLGSAGRLALLHGAGHLPSEESGLADLDRALRDYLDELGVA